ncbi:MAG: hypothetical protein QOE14_873 [Humisphaera sp.]|nr:hypothetical protein [Humisphaera sp.]
MEDAEQMLADAIAKARKLVGDLERQQKELEASPPQQFPSPDQLAQGRQAFANAVAAARRTLKALEDAAADLPAH